MADTPNTAPTGAPIPDAQAGASAVQLDQSQVQLTPNAMEEDQSQKGPVQSQTAQPSQADQSSQQQPQNPQQAQQDQSQQQDQTQKPQQPQQPQQPQKPAAAVPAQHPAVQKASLLHEIATTLAGGPRYQTSIDPNTGQVTRSQVPLSNRQLGMAIALEALSGGIKGLSQTGPNHSAKAAAAGFQQGQEQAQQQQQAEQDQESKAKSDFALKAQTTKNNFQMYQLTRQQSELDYDTNQKHIDTYAPIIETARENGGVKEDGVEGTSADDVAKRFNVATDLVVPEGKPVPRYDPNTGKQAVDPNTGVPLWNLQFAILDPAVAGNISPEMAKKASDYAVPGSFTLDKDGNRVPIKLPESAQLKLGLQASWANAIAAIDTAQAHIGQQLSNLPDGDKYVKELDGNLKHAYENKVSQTALSTASRLATVPIDQWQKTMQTMKTPLDVMGQVMSLIPQDAMDAAVKQTEQKKADAATAAAVEKEGALAPIKTAESAATDRARAAVDIGTAGAKAKAAEIGRVEGRVAEGLPKEAGKGTGGEQPTAELQAAADPRNSDANGLNMTYYNALAKANPNRALAVKAVAEGRNTMSAYALAKEYGGDFMGDVDAYDNSYDQQKTLPYEKLRQSYASGKDSKEIEGTNVTLIHAALAYQHATPTAVNASPKYSKEAATYKDDVDRVVEGVNSAYTSGVLMKEERQSLLDGLNSRLPGVVKASIQEYVKLLADAKIDAKYNTFQNTKPSNSVPDYPLVNPKAAAAYQEVMGKPIDPKYLGGKQTGTNLSKQAPVLSGSGAFMWNGTAWVDNPNKPK